MRGLLACPFCRAMFQTGEAKVCPDCDLALMRVEDLPPAKVVGDELVEELPPDEERLPMTYAARGRGALIAVSVLGIAAFFMPWAHEIMPERRTMTGVGIASHLGWMWAPLVAWLVMIPLVLSRRSIFRMRGARVAVAFLAGMAFLTVAVRVAFPPTGTALDPHRIQWGAGLWVTGLLSLAALFFASRFGGRLDDLSTKKARPKDVTLH